MRIAHQPKYIFEYQTPATLNQANPVQNTWYTILDTTANVCVYSIGIGVEDTDETLECQITIDGETIQANDLACTHSTDYLCIIQASAINRYDEVAILGRDVVSQDNQGVILYGKSVKIQVRKTTNAGVGNLTGIVAYGVLKPC